MLWLILMLTLTLVLLMTFHVDVNNEVDHCCRNRCFNIDGDFFILPLSMLSTLMLLDVVFVDIDADLNVFF